MPRLHAKQTKLSHIDSGSFRPWPGGGAQTPTFAPALPSFVATHDFFAKITQISDFFVFPNFRKVGKFAASIERPKPEVLQGEGGFAPLSP